MENKNLLRFYVAIAIADKIGQNLRKLLKNDLCTIGRAHKIQGKILAMIKLDLLNPSRQLHVQS